ncbi:tRNA (adenosine(37)-N6)-threonylcarbamoyltransferase complex ATPase subunit type 1 TsaE [Polaribacter sp.]|uniref:tRNA (adenosine(37)-N6)-threonylcarbamoyltransferase complex ATPase subunit type 1 TsaE n=1 Tax=Polaribacter sp. TaxID=1920175 RepID=UPI0025EAD91B|nr:tRNA (adenosine(37)-N6)-threonylcarbamoyltransferase complex ATPase subunit type 1 TsaE [Polaribacter sp.]
MDKNYTLEDITQLSKDIIKNAPNNVLLFYGDMGVGKTTLIKQLCKELGSNDIISSPTFSLVNEYTSKNNTVYHFDFYRINNEEEALDIGIEDYLYSNSWCFIEWPENIVNLLPLDAVEIHLTQLESGARNIKIN